MSWRLRQGLVGDVIRNTWSACNASALVKSLYFAKTGMFRCGLLYVHHMISAFMRASLALVINGEFCQTETPPSHNHVELHGDSAVSVMLKLHRDGFITK